MAAGVQPTGEGLEAGVVHPAELTRRKGVRTGVFIHPPPSTVG